MTICKQVTKNGFTLKIVDDPEARSPRDGYMFGTMVCWHKRYNIGDKHNFETPEEFKRLVKEKNIAAILPIYMLDHSGISISTKPFNDPWDSGFIGYIYIEKKKIREEFNILQVTKNVVSRAKCALKKEVLKYDDYLQGNTFGYIIEDSNGDEIDSCYGFIGIDPVENGMVENVSEKYKYLFLINGEEEVNG